MAQQYISSTIETRENDNVITLLPTKSFNFNDNRSTFEVLRGFEYIHTLYVDDWHRNYTCTRII